MSRDGPNAGVRYGAPPPPSNEKFTIPTPDQVKAHVEMELEGEVVALIKQAIDGLKRGSKQHTITTQKESVAALVCNRLQNAGWATKFCYGDQREPGYYITVSFP